MNTSVQLSGIPACSTYYYVQHVLLHVCKSCETSKFLTFVKKKKKQFSGETFFTRESVSLNSFFKFSGRVDWVRLGYVTLGCILLENRRGIQFCS